MLFVKLASSDIDTLYFFDFVGFRRYVQFALEAWDQGSDRPCSQLNAPTNSIFIAYLQMSSMATLSARYAVLSGKNSQVLNLQMPIMEELE